MTRRSIDDPLTPQQLRALCETGMKSKQIVRWQELDRALGNVPMTWRELELSVAFGRPGYSEPDFEPDF